MLLDPAFKFLIVLFQGFVQLDNFLNQCPVTGIQNQKGKEKNNNTEEQNKQLKSTLFCQFCRDIESNKYMPTELL